MEKAGYYNIMSKSFYYKVNHAWRVAHMLKGTEK